MKKIYYPQNLISEVSLNKLKKTYKQIGKQLSENILTYKDLSDTVSGAPVELTSKIYNTIELFFTSVSDTNIDPLMVITCNYLYYNSTKNVVSNIQKESHPLYNIYLVLVKEDVENYEQKFSVTINSGQLKKFLAEYVFYENPYIVEDENVLIICVDLFMGAIKDFLQKSIQQNIQYDYEHFGINKHTTKNLSYLNTQNLYYDFNSEYNYFVKEYEKMLEKTNDPKTETLLPNYYAVQNYLSLEFSRVLESLVSLNGKVSVSKENILNTDYFKKYAKAFRSLTKEEKGNLNKVQNYLVDSYYALDSNNNLSSENFPYVGKIKFSNYPTDSLIGIIESKKLDTLFANNCHYVFANNANQDQKLVPQTQRFFIKDENIYKKLSDNGEYVDLDGLTYALRTRNKFAVESCKKTNLTNIFNFSVDQENNTTGFVVYQNNDYAFMSEQNFKYFKLLNKPSSIFHYISVQTQISNICKKSLNYSNVYNFNTIDCIPLCFQIEKYSSKNTINNIISVARNSTNPEVCINDTQLDYDKPNTYRIYSINLVNSFKYSFVDNLVSDTSTNTLYGSMTLQENCQIYKNLIIDKSFEILDNPPTPVDVNILPIINSTNRILILLNTQSTTLLDEPKVIRKEEIEFFKKIKKKQNLNSKKVLFETVDDLRAVQIFRTTTPPKSYEDFNNNIYRVLEFKKTTSNSLLDDVVQNTKYYYTFRSIDVHNNFSNPTDVFEVQIINSDGAIYPIIKTYEMITDEQNYVFSKSFKKYISINPSVIFTELTTNSDGQVKVGTEKGLWGERYKLRVKSKKSGKSFDVIMSFNKSISNLIDNTNTFRTEPTFEIISDTTLKAEASILATTPDTDETEIEA